MRACVCVRTCVCVVQSLRCILSHMEKWDFFCGLYVSLKNCTGGGGYKFDEFVGPVSPGDTSYQLNHSVCV